MVNGGSINFMFDTTVFNDILSKKINMEKFPEKFHYFVTHIQWDELNRTSDLEVKENLLKIFELIEIQEIPTESTSFDISKFNKAKFGNGKTFEELRRGKLKHTQDALIAETAMKNNLILVTNDKELLRKVKKLKGKVVALEDFLAL